MRKKFILSLSVIFASIIMMGQTTLPSCVITAPHNNAYFMENTDLTINVYSSVLGGTQTGASITNVEFFSDGTKLGESNTANSSTYTFVWEDVVAGTYTLTAKATDNDGSTFTSAGVIITVGAAEEKSIGISSGKGKYLANIIPGNVRSDFNTYWNGVTAENSCKWGSVEGTRDVMNWSDADKAYNHAKNFNMSFRYHVLAWGRQYPEWIESLEPAEFQEEMEEYMAAIAERYPLIDQIDVLNENMHLNSYDGNEHAEGTPYFRAGLGGAGETGYDWAIWLFEKARAYFPNSKLILNDFELVTNINGLNETLDLVKVLRDRGLIDGLGTQSHHFNVDGINTSTLQNALNKMASSGVPVYVTELDLKGSSETEASQLSSYETAFPIYWNHPAVAGITLWGYVEGTTWASGTGILNSDGSERSAMTWLKSFMSSQPDLGYPFANYVETIDTNNNILVNGEFDEATYGWNLDAYNGGSGSFSAVSGEGMSGDNALQICPTAPGTANWHVQVSQDAPFEKDKQYELSFMAVADADLSISVTMQEGGDPYTQYLDEAINLTTEIQSFSYDFEPDVSDATNKLKFFVGLNSDCIYIDKVIFRELVETKIQEKENDLLVSVYPNPVNSGIMTIEHSAPKMIGSVEILDLKGSILKEYKVMQPKTDIDVNFLNKGIYLLKIQNGDMHLSKRIVII